MNILITGGANGLGEAVTKQLAKDKNNKIFITYYRSKKKAEDLAEQSNISAVRCDFTDPKDIIKLTGTMEDMDLDVLINNALMFITKQHAHKLEPEIYLKSFKENIIPTITVTQKAIQIFRKKKQGKIITVLSSSLINNPPIGVSEYVANKAYLWSLCKSWATENASFNITSNAVSPSFMLTDLNKDMDERFVEEMIRKHPLKKLLTVEEVARQIDHMTKCSKQINGVNIVMNAGADLAP